MSEAEEKQLERTIRKFIDRCVDTMAAAMSTPIISGQPAVHCTDPGCMCRGVFADILGQLKCPHCEAHLSPSGVCLNLCGLTVPQYFQFQGMLAEAAAAVGYHGTPSEIGNADPVKERSPV